jgi:hypothetical protein
LPSHRRTSGSCSSSAISRVSESSLPVHSARQDRVHALPLLTQLAQRRGVLGVLSA